MKNKKLIKSLKNSCNQLIRADVYCNVIRELLIFHGTEPFSDEDLKEFFIEDIQFYSEKQLQKLETILDEVSKNDYKN